jgi:hypothetical protein
MRTMVGLLIALMLGLFPADRPGAQEMGSPEPQQDGIGPTPPRLSFVDGHVSFFRPGTGEWTPAPVNMPLSPGDRLQTGSPGNLEIQIGDRAFARGWADSRIELTNQEPDHLQFNVTAGHVAFDLRTLEPGHTVEVDTPNAAFTIDHAGYYRLNVAKERTTFAARRGGRAVVTPADGASFGLPPDEEVAVEGEGHPTVSSYSVPPLDPWDHWNYARTDALLEAESARHVPPGVYGASDLDRYGQWRDVPDYGPVWAPTGVPTGWVPYSTGSWAQDPYYGWTWVDTAPWGWAPYHYGRWVHVSRSWCWAPGPRVARPIYSPALVAFYGGSSSRVAFGTAGPVVGWVALGWGEPCVPWWGRPGFIHRPWWGGWAGPRVVNNMVVHPTTVVHAEHIHDYRNARVPNAVVGVHEDHFHRGGFGKERFTRVDPRDLKPMRSAPRGKETPVSYKPQPQNRFHPPEKDLKRPEVTTRPPVLNGAAERRERRPDAAGPSNPGPGFVQRPQARENAVDLPRRPFGQSTFERRPEAGRTEEPAPPKIENVRRYDRYPEPRPPVLHRQSQQPQQPQGPDRSERTGRTGRQEQTGSRAVATPAPTPHRIEGYRPPARQQPSEPAGRLVPNRLDERSPQQVERGIRAPERFEQRKPAADAGRPASSKDTPAQGVQRPGGRPLALPRAPGGA